MDASLLIRFLAWCSVVNIGLLLLWFIMMMLAKDLIYSVQSRWLNIPRERLDTLNFGMMGLFKLSIWMFNLTPYLVLRALV